MSEDSPFLMSSQAFVISYFLYLNHLVLVLICVYMIVKDVEKFSRYFLAVFISSFENSLLRSPARLGEEGLLFLTLLF